MQEATKDPASPVAHPIVKYRPQEKGDKTGAEVSTEITVLDYVETAKKVLEITAVYTGAVYEVATKPGMEMAKAARRDLVALRTDLERTRESLKAPVIKLGRDIDAQAKAITAAIVAMEEPIDKQISTEEERKKTERETAAKREQERQQDLRSRITAITQMPLTVIGKSSAFMSEVLTKLQAIDTSKAAFQEYAEQAQEAVKVSSEQVSTMITNQVATEAKEAVDAAAAEERRLEAAAAAAAKQIDDARTAEIRAMAKLPTILLRSEPHIITGHIDHLRGLNMSESHWGDRHAEAVDTMDGTLKALQSILEDRIKAAKDEQDAADFRREEAERKRREDAERLEKERVAKEAAEAERLRLEAIQAEERRVREAKEAKERADKERIQAHAAELLDSLATLVNTLREIIDSEPPGSAALDRISIGAVEQAESLVRKARGIE